MQSGVKFIFKSLMTVPVVIFVAFFVFNLFSFTFTYFRLLGASYVVMQTAVENNYIPTTELNTLESYIANIGTGMLQNQAVVVGVNDDGTYRTTVNTPSAVNDGKDARVRKQYGNTVTCGVTGQYVFVWPLTYRETTIGDTGVNGLSGDNFQGFKSDAELQALRENEGIGGKTSRNNITIVYTVPGLKYYPDMLAY